MRPRFHEESGTTLDPDFVGEFLERLLGVARKRDAAGVAALCTDDVIFDDSGMEGALQGKEELIELFTNIYGLVSDFDLDVTGTYLSTDLKVAGATWHASGVLRHPPGQTTEFDTAEFYEFRDGLISRWRFYARDSDWLGRQWGR